VLKIFPPDAPKINSTGQESVNKLNAAETMFQSDSAFDWFYPEHIGSKSARHWTPLHIARKAAGFLAEPGARVLDIGSGVGKFCLAGAYYYPETFFYGVEQRHELFMYATDARDHMHVANVHFIYANMTRINFKEFDHFYFYNSFYENVDTIDAIDDTIESSFSLYNYYTQYLRAALDEKPAGTRVVTYHSSEQEIPSSYCLADVSYDTLLKMWIKI
jgi:SAM-dependent methyltransferase